ncbi:MAG: site-2 protease family protein [Verrucomicrobiota bacterium]
MNGKLIDGLMMYLAFVIFVGLHEFAHAWMAVRCGDETPRQQGRLTLNLAAHMDLIGTVILPLVVTLLSAMSGGWMLLGWGKPVQVNLDNFKQRQRDDILVSAAGPAMNLLTAFAVLAVTKLLEVAGVPAFLDTGLNLARLSLFLCFFNLLPIPPLDGGHIVRNMMGISDEAYAMLSAYSFMFFMLIMRVPFIGVMVRAVTDVFLVLMIWPFGWQLATYSLREPPHLRAAGGKQLGLL